MKKVVSISLIFLVLAAMLHFSVAKHYCGGRLAASKISLSGKFATCGMENDVKKVPQTGSHFETDCCDNVIFFYGINSRYFPSFSSLPVVHQICFQTFSLPSPLNIIFLSSIKTIYTSSSPPDKLMTSSVDLSNICIFRI